MKYCLAIDVSKNGSMFGLFLDTYDNPIIKPIKIVHSKTKLNDFVKECLLITKDKFDIIMEATGPYHKSIEIFFKELNFNVIVLNPMISAFHKTNLRRTKTDKIDCSNLADIYFNNKFNKQYSKNSFYDERVYEVRYIENLEFESTMLINRLKQQLNLVFPELENIKNLTESFYLYLLSKYTHPKEFQRIHTTTIAKILSSVNNCSESRFLVSAKRIKEYANSSMYCYDENSQIVSEIKDLANRIFSLKQKINNHKFELLKNVANNKLFQTIYSFKGIGPYLSAYIASEIGDIDRFDSYKKLIAYCGTDPSLVQSGSSINVCGPISKRGNAHLRHWLFIAVKCIHLSSTTSNRSNPILLYYEKKRNEGKPYCVSIIACVNKLLRMIYYRYQDNK